MPSATDAPSGAFSYQLPTRSSQKIDVLACDCRHNQLWWRWNRALDSASRAFSPPSRPAVQQVGQEDVELPVGVGHQWSIARRRRTRPPPSHGPPHLLHTTDLDLDILLVFPVMKKGLCWRIGFFVLYVEGVKKIHDVVRIDDFSIKQRADEFSILVAVGA